MIELHAIAGPTGRLLREMLREKGLLTGAPRGRVNYGYGGRCALPTLNERAGTLNKLQELEALARAGVLTVPFSTNPLDLQAPLFGRKIHHTRGNDIVLVQCGRPNPARRVSDFYTHVVPKRKEFRVWAFRGQPIGTYEKVLQYPTKNGRGGRSRDVWNWRNGYAYVFVHQREAARELKATGVAAIAALGLDFGAVDIIEGNDGRYYVLEVNTAPGVEGRRQGITSLVTHIEEWARAGFPAREARRQETRAAAVPAARTEEPRVNQVARRVATRRATLRW